MVLCLFFGNAAFYNLHLLDCQMSCHIHCKDKVYPTCPLPPGQGNAIFVHMEEHILRVFFSLLFSSLSLSPLLSLLFFLSLFLALTTSFIAKLPFGIDIHHGVGTACEGWIHLPRPGGVKKGWNRAYAFVCDFKVFLHEPSNDIHTPANSSSYIFDIRYAII